MKKKHSRPKVKYSKPMVKKISAFKSQPAKVFRTAQGCCMPGETTPF